MKRTRLDIEAPDLTKQFARLNDREQRAVALAVARLAIDQTDLHMAIVDVALRALGNAEYGDEELMGRLQDLIERLDRKYFHVQEQYEQGVIDKETYVAFFCQARAANAVLFAFDKDAFTAAAEASYEAIAAVGVDNVRSAVASLMQHMH